MQAKIKTEPYEYFDPVFDGSHEIPIDTEYSLPDYCADVQRILKCCIVPEISSYAVSEETITCDGICDIRILYLDAKGEGIKCCEFTKEFNAVFKSKTSETQAVAYIKAVMGHVTCRAVNARRIDLHMAISLEVFAVAQRLDRIATGIDDITIEKRTKNIHSSQAVNAVCHQFSVEEYIPLKSGKPPIENILRKEIVGRISDMKIEPDTIIVNGTVDIGFLYNSFVDGITTEKMSAGIDFTQMIACAGIDKDCVCDMKIVCGESSIQPKEDSTGECTGVTVFTKLFITAFMYRDSDITMIDDAYSVAKPVLLDYTQSNFIQICGEKRDVLRNKCPMVLQGEEIQKVIDIWNENTEISAFCDKEKLQYRIKYTVCLLFMNAQNRILYIEKTFDFSQSFDLPDENIKKCKSVAATDVWEYRITDKNNVEVSLETTVNSMFYSRFAVKQLTSAEADETITYQPGKSKLSIYYAYEGEALWDIAKEHKALLSDIRAQNELYEDNITDSGPIIICNR
jgi:hypothetical protein